MKKFIGAVTAIIITMGITISASAQSLGCEVSVKDVTVQQKGQVTIPVEISSNNGFTNAAILLDYDRQQLELVSINTTDGENKYLCGDLASANTAWTDGEEKNYGYIVIASDTEITDNGVLFTATFNMKDEFAENATVTPTVKYMRNNTALFSMFENVNATSCSGEIILEDITQTPEIIPGDFDGNGQVDVMDITAAIIAYQNRTELTQTQKPAIDTNDNGIVDIMEITELIIRYQNR